MTLNGFRTIALSFPDTAESAHMNHPDFRVGGKIFATLGYPNREWGVVALTPDEQARFCETEPKVFVPVGGAWGREGSTQVLLQEARKASVRSALAAAWRNRVAKNSTTPKKAGRKTSPRTRVKE